MNKKGAGESLMFLVFLLIMVIVASGISLGVFLFFGQGYDFRGAEAGILKDKFVSCLKENSDKLDEGFDLVADCGFTEKVKEKHLIYLKRLSDGVEFFEGVISYKEECLLDSGEKNVNFPRCASSVISLNGEKFEVVVGSSQDSRRLIG